MTKEEELKQLHDIAVECYTLITTWRDMRLDINKLEPPKSLEEYIQKKKQK